LPLRTISQRRGRRQDRTMPDQSRHYRTIVERAVEMARTGADVRVSDICRTIGVSGRTLLRAFRAVHGDTPSHHLVVLRLRAARRELLAANDEIATVTAVATSLGFVELGRFAVVYRSIFGECPSTTLRRSSESKRGARRHAIRPAAAD